MIEDRTQIDAFEGHHQSSTHWTAVIWVLLMLAEWIAPVVGVLYNRCNGNKNAKFALAKHRSFLVFLENPRLRETRQEKETPSKCIVAMPEQMKGFFLVCCMVDKVFTLEDVDWCLKSTTVLKPLEIWWNSVLNPNYLIQARTWTVEQKHGSVSLPES